MSKWTDADVAYLVEAVWQVLDDMGADGRSCCGAANAQLRNAYEPFHSGFEPMDMPLRTARLILEECEQLPEGQTP
jgi:hypothetical protein